MQRDTPNDCHLSQQMQQITLAGKKLPFTMQSCSVVNQVHRSQTSDMQTCIATTPISQTQQLAMPPLKCYHTDFNVAAQLWDALAVSLMNWISDTYPQECSDLQSPMKCSGCSCSCMLASETTYCTTSVDQEVHTGFRMLL